MLINFLAWGQGDSWQLLKKCIKRYFPLSLVKKNNNNNKKNSMPGHMQKVELINLMSDTQ